MENQLTILSESLDKKIQVLHAIQTYNTRQEQIFSSGQADMSAFDEAVEEKGRLIDSLTQLDEGFDTLYANIAEQIKDRREQYADQIREIQTKIKHVMDLSVSIQTQEARNKQLIEQYFARERQGLQQNRKSSAAAYNYYKKMSNADYLPPQYMDSKQ
jgi:flagellar biosynthesis/type III secretory pathway chaperone